MIAGRWYVRLLPYGMIDAFIITFFNFIFCLSIPFFSFL